ncbi:hypothetical protein [Synechococcus sp. RedBA-s]|uniref:hypothetical protein n=1 Tax=Synechococcus sp. RedBA-s TaxID=2823741 RepID=UPI0020CC7C8F|nr:hypothetical protein [Synechococcus sp. RedBA-s]MCP9799179.1 hypothetical protein [Synechococcus sp. RedBA-s]
MLLLVHPAAELFFAVVVALLGLLGGSFRLLLAPTGLAAAASASSSTLAGWLDFRRSGQAGGDSQHHDALGDGDKTTGTKP